MCDAEKCIKAVCTCVAVFVRDRKDETCVFCELRLKCARLLKRGCSFCDVAWLDWEVAEVGSWMGHRVRGCNLVFLGLM